MIVILSIGAFCMLYGIGGIGGLVGMKVLCSLSIIIGVTWWIICYKQQELLDEIKDLKKEIKKLEEKK